MGERGQIKIKDNGVYLYTHWGGAYLKEDLKKALSKKWRWDDSCYLARIIFDVMIGDDKDTETGYGIDNIEHMDLNHPLIEVDVVNQIIIIEGKNWSFEKFIKTKFKEV